MRKQQKTVDFQQCVSSIELACLEVTLSKVLPIGQIDHVSYRGIDTTAYDIKVQNVFRCMHWATWTLGG